MFPKYNIFRIHSAFCCTLWVREGLLGEISVLHFGSELLSIILYEWFLKCQAAMLYLSRKLSSHQSTCFVGLICIIVPIICTLQPVAWPFNTENGCIKYFPFSIWWIQRRLHLIVCNFYVAFSVTIWSQY